MNLIFIGLEYYIESGTSMSPIYHEGTWMRSDWGKAEIALGKGETVTIRPATTDELDIANLMLLKIKQREQSRD
jgi:hypothetical protein